MTSQFEGTTKTRHIARRASDGLVSRETGSRSGFDELLDRLFANATNNEDRTAIRCMRDRSTAARGFARSVAASYGKECRYG